MIIYNQIGQPGENRKVRHDPGKADLLAISEQGKTEGVRDQFFNHLPGALLPPIGFGQQIGYRASLDFAPIVGNGEFIAMPFHLNLLQSFIMYFPPRPPSAKGGGEDFYDAAPKAASLRCVLILTLTLTLPLFSNTCNEPGT
jgi:hypothetical protein